MKKPIINYRGKQVLYYSFKGKIFRFTTKIPTKDKNIPENRMYLDKLLERFNAVISNYYKEYNINPDADYVKNKLLNFNHLHKGFLDFYNDFIKTKKIKPQSLSEYTGTQSTLIKFEQKNGAIDLNKINTKFINDYLQHLYSLNYSNNTIRKRLIILKAYINYLVSNELIKKTQINYSQVDKNKSYYPDIITLTKEELKFIIEKRKTEIKYIKVLDMFITQSLTSLRFSDLIRINKYNVKNQQLIIDLLKTNKTITVKLPDIVLNILQTNNFNLNYYKQAQYNKLLGDMFEYYSKEMVSFKDEVIFTKKVGSNTINKVCKRYELIKSHTGRRTFINNMIENNVPLNLIMLYTGHQKIDILNHYINKYHNTKSNLVNDTINNLLN